MTAYGVAALEATVSRGFTLGTSRLSGATLHTTAATVDLSGGIVSLSLEQASTVDGLDVLPDVATLTFTTRTDPTPHLGLPLTVRVRGGQAFFGIIDDVAWTTEVAPGDPRATDGLITTWTVTAHGLELLRLNAPVVISRTARTPGVRVGTPAEMTTPWGQDDSASQVVLADLLRDVSGQIVPRVEGFLGLPANPDQLYPPAAWGDDAGGRTAAVYSGVDHMLRDWLIDPIEDLDAGIAQRDRLLAIARLVGGRVTADATVVPRAQVGATLTWSPNWVRAGLVGRADATAPQGVRLTCGTDVVITSRGPLRWADWTFDESTVPISETSWTPAPPPVGFIDPLISRQRRLGVAAARVPIPPLTPARVITATSADPTALEEAADLPPAQLWAAPLPWRLTGAQTATVLGVRHRFVADDPTTTRPGWTTELELGPDYLTEAGNDLWPTQPQVTEVGATLSMSATIADGIEVVAHTDPGATLRALGGPGRTRVVDLDSWAVDNVNVFKVDVVADAAGIARTDLPIATVGPTSWVLVTLDVGSGRQSPPTEVRIAQP